MKTGDPQLGLTDLVDALRAGRVGRISNSNPAGLLWERTYRWTAEGGFQVLLEGPGQYNDWFTFDTGEQCFDSWKRGAAEFFWSI